MEFHFENDSPVYLQMAKMLETMVVSGRFPPGSKLPSVRELAMESKTNPNTVSKALAELERKGLIETRRTAGKFVRESAGMLEESRRQNGEALCREFLKAMASLGYTPAEIFSQLERMMNHASDDQ